jgi:rhodanese-related sulfurtransferase
MKFILIIMTFLSSLFGAKAQQADSIKVLNATEYKTQVVNKDVQLVDVRTAAEFNQGALDNALNIDFFQKENFRSKMEKLDKEKPVYLYCRSGARSNKAATLLDKMGFTKIYDLKGGFLGWPY